MLTQTHLNREQCLKPLLNLLIQLIDDLIDGLYDPLGERQTQDAAKMRLATQRIVNALEHALEHDEREQLATIAEAGHDLRNYLHHIIGYSTLFVSYPDLYDGEVLLPRQQSVFEDVLAIGQQLLGVINNLAQYAKIKVDDLSEVMPIQFNIYVVLDELIQEHGQDHLLHKTKSRYCVLFDIRRLKRLHGPCLEDDVHHDG